MLFLGNNKYVNPKPSLPMPQRCKHNSKTIVVEYKCVSVLME